MPSLYRSSQRLLTRLAWLPSLMLALIYLAGIMHDFAPDADTAQTDPGRNSAAPVVLVSPSPGFSASLYPPAAAQKGLDGQVDLECAGLAGAKPTGCQVVRETPQDSGFTAPALRELARAPFAPAPFATALAREHRLRITVRFQTHLLQGERRFQVVNLLDYAAASRPRPPREASGLWLGAAFALAMLASTTWALLWPPRLRSGAPA